MACAEGHGPTVENLLDRLIFKGAHPYEHRGVSDAGLSIDELQIVLKTLPKNSGWWESIFNITVGYFLED